MVSTVRTHAVAVGPLGAALCIPILSACGGSSPPGANPPHERYLGIGAYTPGLLWARVAAASPLNGSDRARPADDEHVIVLLDSRTGEVRECGDYSGACVSLSPWAQHVPAERSAPVSLSEHLSDAVRDDKDARRQAR